MEEAAEGKKEYTPDQAILQKAAPFGDKITSIRLRYKAEGNYSGVERSVRDFETFLEHQSIFGLNGVETIITKIEEAKNRTDLIGKLRRLIATTKKGNTQLVIEAQDYDPTKAGSFEPGALREAIQSLGNEVYRENKITGEKERIISISY